VTPAGTVMYDEWIDDDPAETRAALRLAKRQYMRRVREQRKLLRVGVVLPSNAATRPQSAFTLGSSNVCSSPTGAAAITWRISGVGSVCVSL